MSPPYVNLFPIVINVDLILSLKFPAKILGSEDVSYVYSPGSAQTSTTLPCSTIIIHCPFATAIPEPLLIMLSLPFVLEDLAPVRF